jgi:hypothetical protein
MSQIFFRPTASGGSGVDSVTGTANQVTAAPTTGDVILSTPALFIAPGSIESTTTTTAGTGLTVTTGNAVISAGNLTLPTTSSSAGNILINAERFVHHYGTGNTFLGALSGNYTTTGTFNTGLGQEVLTAVTSGGSNALVGYQAGKALSSGGNNQALGSQNLLALTTGTNNTATGPGAGYQLVSGSHNVLLGGTGATQVGKNYTGAESSNILIHNIGTLGESNTIRIGTQGAGAGQQNQFFAAGIYGVSVTTPQTVTIDSNGQLGSSATFGMTWSTVTVAGPTALAVNSGYVINFAGTATLTMPTVATVGSVIEILQLDRTVGDGFSIDCNGRTIYKGTSTAVATLSYANSAAPDDLGGTLRLICVVENTTWQVTSSTGSSFVSV